MPAELVFLGQRRWERSAVTTHLILATLAFMTEIADSTGFKGDSVPRFQVGHFCANFIRSVRCHSIQRGSRCSTLSDYSRGLVAEDLKICRSVERHLPQGVKYDTIPWAARRREDRFDRADKNEPEIPSYEIAVKDCGRLK